MSSSSRRLRILESSDSEDDSSVASSDSEKQEKEVDDDVSTGSSSQDNPSGARNKDGSTAAKHAMQREKATKRAETHDALENAKSGKKQHTTLMTSFFQKGQKKKTPPPPPPPPPSKVPSKLRSNVAHIPSKSDDMGSDDEEEEAHGNDGVPGTGSGSPDEASNKKPTAKVLGDPAAENVTPENRTSILARG